MVKITVDKSFFYAIASVLAVVAILAIGMWVTRDAGQQTAAPDVAPAAQPAAQQPVAPVAPGADVAPPPVDVGAPPVAGLPPGGVPVTPPPAPDGSIQSIMAGGEITAEQDAAVSRIAPNDALELLTSPDYVWVDVRTAEEYAASHIPGAVSVPAYTEDGRLSELPKDKTILLYCA